MDFAAQLASWRSGDFNRFVGAYYGFVYSVVQSRLRDETAAEELSQDIFLKIHTKDLLGQFKGECAQTLLAWLARIAHNECLMLLRRKQKGPVTVELTPGAAGAAGAEMVRAYDPFEQTLQKETNRRILDAVAGLDLKYRTVIDLRMAGYRNSEIAAILKVGESTVATRMERGLEILRKELKE